jgi:crotonobetainyl-CoA:carnitine CoA-transferase CaiB-like acyl-CoA transferase
MAGPLDGIRILDLSQVVSGPMATMLLSDQGADVIKVEPTNGAVDVTRSENFAKGGLSALFINNNRGKRGITLDLPQDAGREILLELAAKADVFVQNFRPGAVERLRIDYKEICKVNPEIIYVSISGFGPTGPYAGRPVYDPIIQGLSGIVWRQLNPEIPIPDLVRNLVADKTTALTVAQAISTGLFHRERKGVGQHIEIPMIDAFLYFFWPDGMTDNTVIDEDATDGYLLSTVYRLSPTSDGRVIYFVANETQRENLYIALGHPEWADDPNFASLVAAAKSGNLEKLGGMIADAFLDLTTDDAMRRMLEHDVPCGAILEPKEVLDDPQILHNKTMEIWHHPEAGQIRSPRPAARFSATPAELGRSAPHVGEHNEAVLGELGRSAEEIASLRKEGVVG